MTVAWLLALGAHAAFLVAGVRLIDIDVRQRRLPNRIVLPLAGVVAALLAAAAVAEGDAWRMVGSLAAGAGLGGFYLALRAADAGGMGGGDVKLAVVIGMLLGWHGWSALLLGAASAFVLGALCALWLIATARASRDAHIAFGPWMILGAWIGVALA